MTAELDQIEGLRTRAVRIIRERTGLHESLALPIAREIVEGIAREFGGDRYYFRQRDRDVAAKVRAEFNGENRDELCKLYGISRSTFYRFIAKGASE